MVLLIACVNFTCMYVYSVRTCTAIALHVLCFFVYINVQGVYVDETYDIGRIEDVHWNPWYSI